MADGQTLPTVQRLTAGDERELSRLLSLYTARTRQQYGALARLSSRLAAGERALGKKWSDEDSAELNALLVQYESLRTESLNTINNRVQILVLGIAAIGAVAGGAVAVDKPADHAGVISALFSGAIPLLCIFVLFVWVSEAVRSHRVGSFLAGDTEARINAKIGRLVMTWEASLWAERQPRDETFGPSMMALSIVGLLACLAPLFGLFLTGGFQRWPEAAVALGVPYVLLVASALYVRGLLARLQNDPVVRSTWPGEDEAEAIKEAVGGAADESRSKPR